MVAIFWQDDRKLRPPLLRPGEPLALLFRWMLGRRRNQCRDEILEIRTNRQVGLDRRFFQLDGVNVDPRLESLACKARPIVADLPDVEPAAEDQQEVGALRHHVAAAVADGSGPSA